MKRLIFFSLFLGLIFVSSKVSAQEADAYDILVNPTDIVFSYTAPLAGQVTFRSPLRNANGTDNFPMVNSKYAQPRNEGTNPHIGVDLHAIQGTNVHPVREGQVYYSDIGINDTDDGPFGRVTIQFDVNGDGIYDPYPFPNDNLFVTYLHMRRIQVRRGDNVNINTIVGEVSNTCTPCRTPIPVHLHWEINTITGASDCRSNLRASGCTAVRTSMYYTGLTGTQWNGGRDLVL